MALDIFKRYEDWLSVYSLQLSISEQQFWNALKVWNTKPHLINKSVGGLKLVDLGCHEGYTFFNDLFTVVRQLDLKGIQSYTNYRSAIMELVENTKCNLHKSKCEQTNNKKNQIWLKLLCPKTKLDELRTDLALIVLFNFSEKLAAFSKPIINGTLPKLSPDVSYVIQFNKNLLSLKVPASTTVLENDFKWFQFVLIPAIVRWSKTEMKSSINSLSLVPADEYCFLYQNLKDKYWGKLCDIWTESTDPKKFIHEDIAIATYLILLWKHELTNFVDLGCGNGLLVHILNSEKHTGIGIDVRARKIWQKYPPSTVLKVATVIPSDSSLFPEADWIIGNHSDELSPWIPVIATRSSYKCKFFLLPCCAYEFDGRKYGRGNSSQSHYADYVEHLKNISRICGFQIKVDRLRIPSTKRICIVGASRTYRKDEADCIDAGITEYINSRTPTDGGLEDTGQWAKTFTPRESNERVRNCTQLNRRLVEDIISSVAKILLGNRTCSLDSVWDEGKETSLVDIVNAVPRKELVQLKSECGGLKTLLRNHHHIFRVEKGMVQFRRPVPFIGDSKDIKHWKKKPCWFYKNHPDTCPLQSEFCSFIH